MKKFLICELQPCASNVSRTAYKYAIRVTIAKATKAISKMSLLTTDWYSFIGCYAVFCCFKKVFVSFITFWSYCIL